jgi:hypothetical protein
LVHEIDTFVPTFKPARPREKIRPPDGYIHPNSPVHAFQKWNSAARDFHGRNGYTRNPSRICIIGEIWFAKNEPTYLLIYVELLLAIVGGYHRRSNSDRGQIKFTR